MVTRSRRTNYEPYPSRKPDAQPPQRCACSAIDFNTLDPREPLASSQKVGKIDDLFINPACDLCGVISTAGRLHRCQQGQEAYIAAVFTSVLIRCRATRANDWWLIRENGEPNDTTSYVVIVPKRQIRENWEIRGTKYHGFVCPVQSRKEKPGWHARRLGREVDVIAIRDWLKTCSEEHGPQCLGDDSVELNRPLRMIDCAARSIVWQPPGASYIALTYVWGSGQSQFCPKNCEIPAQLPDALPATIEDAIKLTSLLGLKYLWVDQYCIDQHDETEVAAQIAQMDSIYRNSWLTIAAAAGDNADNGLPGIPGRARKLRRTAEANGVPVMAVPSNPEEIIRSSTWMKRGWTYQEAILSRRLLVFSGQVEVYLECEQSRYTESTDLPFKADDFQISPNEWYRQHLFSSIRETQIPGAFNEVFLRVKDFSKRRLTYASDTMNAIQGIFNSFLKTYPAAHHVWGLPIVPEQTLDTFEAEPFRPFTRTEQLLRSLCWYQLGRGTRNPAFPSWCWTGWYDGKSSVDGSYHHVLNSFGIKIAISASEGGHPDITLEDYLSAAQRSPIRPAQPRCLILDAMVAKATIVLSEKSNLSASEGQYFVVFPGPPIYMMKNYVRLTSKKDRPGHEGMATHKENLLGIPLGEQVVEDNLAEHHESCDPSQKVWRCHIMLLVQETPTGWERVGLATFDEASDSYFIPKTLQLCDGRTARKIQYNRQTFQRIPFFRRQIRLV